MAEELVDVERRRTELSGIWQECFDARRNDFMPVVRREMPLDLSELLGKQYRFPVQVPNLRDAANEHIAVLLLNQAKVIMEALEHSRDAKADIEETETWFTSMMNLLNQGRFVDKWRSEGQVLYGYGVTRMVYEKPLEPEDDDLEPFYLQQEADGKERNKDNARMEYYRHCASHAWRKKAVDPLSIMWGPNLNDPEVFEEKVDLPMVQFGRLRTSEGKALGWDGLKNIFILGEGEDGDYNRQEWQGKTIEYMRENVRDPKTGKWMCNEYARAPNAGVDGVKLNTYEIPFPYPEYEVTPGGDEMVTEQNPHRRFSPMLYGLLVSCHELNFLLTTQMELALAQAAGKNEYLDISRASPELVQAFTEDGFEIVEGRGAQQMVRVPKVGGTSTETMAAYPGQIAPLPSATNEYMLRRIDFLLNVEIPRQMPNRYLTGQIQPQHTAASTGSGLVQMQEGASIPYDKALRAQDESKERDIWRIIHCIKKWDEGYEPAAQKQYPIVAGHGATATGSHTTDVITINAKKLSRHFDVSVLTKRTTMAEEMEREAQALAKYREGHLTEVELYEKMGYPNPLEHIKELNIRRHRIAAMEQFAVEEASERQKLYDLLRQLAMPVGAGAGDAPSTAAPGGNAGAGAPPPAPPNGGGPPNPEGGGAMGGQMVPPGAGNYPRPRAPMSAPMTVGPEGGTAGFAG